MERGPHAAQMGAKGYSMMDDILETAWDCLLAVAAMLGIVVGLTFAEAINPAPLNAETADGEESLYLQEFRCDKGLGGYPVFNKAGEYVGCLRGMR